MNEWYCGSTFFFVFSSHSHFKSHRSAIDAKKKLMAKYLKLLFVAIFASMSFALTSCGDDDDDAPNNPDNGGGSTKGQYSFTFNGTTFYYGCDFVYPGMEFLGTQSYIENSFDLNKSLDYCLLLINAQDTPVVYIDENGDFVSSYDRNYTANIEGTFNLKYFNPKTAKKGDVLTFSQAVRSDISGSNNPIYLLDASNHLYYRSSQDNFRSDIIYTWRSTTAQTVKFVSYKEDPDTDNSWITLEFNNLTLDIYQGEDYSNHPYQRNQAVINGTITFSSSVCG